MLLTLVELLIFSNVRRTCICLVLRAKSVQAYYSRIRRTRFFPRDEAGRLSVVKFVRTRLDERALKNREEHRVCHLFIVPRNQGESSRLYLYF